MGFMDFLADKGLKYLGPLLQSNPITERMANKFAINLLVNKVAARPHALCTGWDYPCWDGLTNRHYSGRHLPPAEPGYVESLPDMNEVSQLFARPASGGRKSEKSTDLFANFAQWFTDGFLRTDRTSTLMNTSNHEIDISPLYGRTKLVADTLRAGTREGENVWTGGRGRLKSQLINGAEFPPYFFRQDAYGSFPAHWDPKLRIPRGQVVAAASIVSPKY